jgi:geranylgeranyl pyrophosphate synthase
LYRFGLNIGTAFQMADDLLDLAGEEEKIGKPVGNDIRNGRLTLPLIHTLRVLNGTGREELISLLGQGDLRPDDFLKVRRLVHEAGGIDYAQRAALNLVTQGKRELEGLTPSEARATLSRLADYVTQRRR